MPDEVIVVLKLRVRRDAVDEVKDQIDEFTNDFLDESIAKQEGDIEVQEV